MMFIGQNLLLSLTTKHSTLFILFTLRTWRSLCIFKEVSSFYFLLSSIMKLCWSGDRVRFIGSFVSSILYSTLFPSRYNLWSILKNFYNYVLCSVFREEMACFYCWFLFLLPAILMVLHILCCSGDFILVYKSHCYRCCAIKYLKKKLTWYECLEFYDSET